MAKYFGNPEIEMTDSGRNAVRDLVELGQLAVDKNREVVHYWQE